MYSLTNVSKDSDIKIYIKGILIFIDFTLSLLNDKYKTLGMFW